MIRRNLRAYEASQVFLNHPFDAEFGLLGEAMAFAVVAGGLLPVSARDVSSPDKPRLPMLVEAIQSCRYSVHDLSRCTGEGAENLARMNMPLEMGMAMYHALSDQHRQHRCMFLVGAAHGHERFASDLAGLDPYCHNNDAAQVLTSVYDWLRGVVHPTLFSVQATARVTEKHHEFVAKRAALDGGGQGGEPTHDEVREVMYQICTECGWWDWRSNRHGKEEFPETPLAWL